MKILLFACIAALLFAQGSSSILVQRGKVGQTIELELGVEVMDVQAEIQKAGDGEEDRMYIVKNGTITDYGLKRYGDRLSFKNGTLIIENLTANDAVSYFYFLYGNPQQPAAIDVVIE
ncbi:hypothetical protein ACH3XW_8670 [Acanthocheilonema viteae]